MIVSLPTPLGPEMMTSIAPARRTVRSAATMRPVDAASASGSVTAPRAGGPSTLSSSAAAAAPSRG